MIKTILNSIRRAYLDSSYQNKLVTSMFLIIMLPVILMTTLSYYRNIQTIKSQSLSISELYLQQAETSINSKLTELANAALNLSRNNNIFDILGKDPQSITVSEQISDLKELELDASHYLDSPIIYNIRIYVKDG